LFVSRLRVGDPFQQIGKFVVALTSRQYNAVLADALRGVRTGDWMIILREPYGG
jgi:hypothetical protein